MSCLKTLLYTPPFFLLLENHHSPYSIKMFNLCGLVKWKLTSVWPMRTLHLLAQRWSGLSSSTIQSPSWDFHKSHWEGCPLLLHVEKDFSEKKTSRNKKWREKKTVFQLCSLNLWTLVCLKLATFWCFYDWRATKSIIRATKSPLSHQTGLNWVYVVRNQKSPR